jgi:hypothetical protein
LLGVALSDLVEGSFFGAGGRRTVFLEVFIVVLSFLVFLLILLFRGIGLQYMISIQRVTRGTNKRYTHVSQQ